jgi:hypothetical protein
MKSMNCISTTGTHPHVRRAGRRAGEADLRDRGVDHPHSPKRSCIPSVTLKAPP